MSSFSKVNDDDKMAIPLTAATNDKWQATINVWQSNQRAQQHHGRWRHRGNCCQLQTESFLQHFGAMAALQQPFLKEKSPRSLLAKNNKLFWLKNTTLLQCLSVPAALQQPFLEILAVPLCQNAKLFWLQTEPCCSIADHWWHRSSWILEENFPGGGSTFG